MYHTCTPILVGVATSVLEIIIVTSKIWPNFPFEPWTMVIKNINQSKLAQKNSCKYRLMSQACTPILVGGASPVSEILLPSKTAKFPFLTMDYIVHGHQKI